MAAEEGMKTVKHRTPSSRLNSAFFTTCHRVPTGASQRGGRRNTTSTSRQVFPGSAEILQAHLVLVKGPLSYFPHCCDKRPQKSDFRKEVFVLSSQFESTVPKGRHGGRRMRQLVISYLSLIASFRGQVFLPPHKGSTVHLTGALSSHLTLLPPCSLQLGGGYLPPSRMPLPSSKYCYTSDPRATGPNDHYRNGLKW